MIFDIRGYVVYEENDYHLCFDKLDKDTNLICYPSSFPLIDSELKDFDYGVYFEIVDNTAFLRGLDISHDKYLETENNLFYTWHEIWTAYERFKPQSFRYYMLKDDDEDIVSIAILSDKEYEKIFRYLCRC